MRWQGKRAPKNQFSLVHFNVLALSMPKKGKRSGMGENVSGEE